jgi:hypothetical protein
VFERYEIDPTMFDDIKGTQAEQELQQNPIIDKIRRTIENDDDELVSIFICPVLEKKLSGKPRVLGCVKKYFLEEFGINIESIKANRP